MVIAFEYPHFLSNVRYTVFISVCPVIFYDNVNSPYFDGVFFCHKDCLWCVDDNNELGIKVKIFTLYFKNADNHI